MGKWVPGELVRWPPGSTRHILTSDVPLLLAVTGSMYELFSEQGPDFEQTMLPLSSELDRTISDEIVAGLSHGAIEAAKKRASELRQIASERNGKP